MFKVNNKNNRRCHDVLTSFWCFYFEDISKYLTLKIFHSCLCFSWERPLGGLYNIVPELQCVQKKFMFFFFINSFIANVLII